MKHLFDMVKCNEIRGKIIFDSEQICTSRSVSPINEYEY
jgi:hypothetical protein